MAHAPLAHVPMAAAAQPKGEENSLDVKGLWNAFRRRWFLATSVGVVLGACAAVPAYMLTPAPYETFAEFHISSAGDPLLPDRSLPRPQYPIWKQSQMKLVRRNFVINAALRDPKVAKTQTLAGAIRQVDWLQQNLRVEESGAEYFRIGLAGEHPEELKLIVDAICRAYLSEVAASEDKEWGDRVDRFTEARRELQRDLDLKYIQLKKYAEMLKRDPTAEGDPQGYNAFARVMMMQQLVEVRRDLMEAGILRDEIANEEPRQSDGEAPANGEAPADDEVAANDEMGIPKATLERHMASMSPEYAEVYDKLPGLERLAERSRENLTEYHPRRVEAEEGLAEAKQRLELLEKDLLPQVIEALRQGGQEAIPSSIDELDRRIALMESHETALVKELEQLKTAESDAGEFAVDIDRLQKEIDQLQSFEAKLAAFVTQSDLINQENSATEVTMVQPADLPVVRNMKKKTTMAGGAGLGMMGLFVAGVVFLEYRTRRVSTVEEVTGGLNLRIMGLVPQMPRNIAPGKSAKSQAKSAYWSSVLTESIDSIRTQLLRDASLEPLNCLMIASAMSGEGKTTLCCHLAMSLARAGRKVVLVDCDVRRPSIHRVFHLPTSVGVCEVLRGETPLEEAVVELESLANLSIIPAGAFCHQVPQLLAQDRLGAVLEPLKKQFDFVVIDSSPILPVTDSLLVAQHADAAILAVRRDISRLPKVHAAGQRLAMLGVPILGAVAIGLHEEIYDYRPGRGYAYGYQPANGSAPAITRQSAEV